MDKLINERGLRHLAEILDNKYQPVGDYATKSELNDLDLSIFKMVSELPADNIDENKVYLVPSTETEENNIYTEYAYKNNAWEKLGEYKSDVDLSEYVKSETIFEGIPEGYVDLGLPSGKLWASCNLGASTETEYGDYYMWGSTTPNTNDVCDWEHAPFNNGSSSFDSTYFNAHKGEWLDDGALKPEYDAVYQATGGKAHMPTSQDIYELIQNTNSTWTSVNGVNGRILTSKSDSSKKIFIPASGIRINSIINYQAVAACLWSKDYNDTQTSGILALDNNQISTAVNPRYYGICLRPVCNFTSGGKKIKPELLTDYANTDLSNITTEGENKIKELAGVDLFQNYALSSTVEALQQQVNNIINSAVNFDTIKY